MKRKPTVAELRSAFIYDPATGLLRWKQHRTRRFVGEIAGCIHKPTGYVIVSLKDWKLRGHVAAWVVHYGKWPRFDLDHEDLDKTNNRIQNLRRSNKSRNGANRPPQRNNVSGYKGVFWHRGARKWMAQVKLSGALKYLGLFEDPREAAKIYDARLLSHFGEFARTNAHMGLV